jgi:competence protein ComGC
MIRMVKNEKIFLLIISVLITTIFLSCSKSKQEEAGSAGTVTSLVGNVEIYKVSSSQWSKLSTASKIEFGDSIRTARESQVEIRFTDEYSIKIQENSKIAIPTIQSPD